MPKLPELPKNLEGWIREPSSPRTNQAVLIFLKKKKYL